MRILLPPVLFLALIALVYLMSNLDPVGPGAMHKTGIPFGEIAATISVGLLLLIGARVQFRHSDSEIMTFDKPRNLVTKGLFRFSRNPMYLGFLLLLLAMALYFNRWDALIAPAIFFLAAQYWYIPFEEEAAEEAFGDPYLQYKKKVRRWI